jgi:hypothetical protein
MMNMKELEKKRRSQRANLPLELAFSLAVEAVGTGCTHIAKNRSKTIDRLTEESKALTTAVVESLESQPFEKRDVFTETALGFAKQDQRVEGLPLKPFDVPALFAGLGVNNTAFPLVPKTTPQAAREEVAERFATEDKLIAHRAKLESRLIDMGAQAEEARNKRISWWTRFSTWTIALVGGGIALVIFCPLAVPIIGRLLAWLVGKLPGLASSVGVVSVKAFDAVVRGIENAKASTAATADKTSVAPTVPVANSMDAAGDSRRNKPASWIDHLQNQLSREMDAAHKALVRSRKNIVRR